MKKIDRKIGFLKAAIAMVVALALVFPGATAFANEDRREGTTGVTVSNSLNNPPVIVEEFPHDGTNVPPNINYLKVVLQDAEDDLINWTIECSNGDSSFKDYTGSGAEAKCYLPSGLDENSSYTWYVNATDTGSGQTTSVLYSFDTGYWVMEAMDSSGIAGFTSSGEITSAVFTFTTEPAPLNQDVVFEEQKSDYRTNGNGDRTVLTTENQPPVVSDPTPVGDNVPISTTEFSVTIEDPEGDNFDWRIDTSPFCGFNMSSADSNGTKAMRLLNLQYDTTYTVYVNATDTGHVILINGMWHDILASYEVSFCYDASQIEIVNVTLSGTAAEFPHPYTPWWTIQWPVFWNTHEAEIPNQRYLTAGALNLDPFNLPYVPIGSGTLFKIVYNIKADAASGDTPIDLLIDQSVSPPRQCSYISGHPGTAVPLFPELFDGVVTISGGAEPNDPTVFSGENPVDTATGVSIGISSLSVLIEDPEGDSFDWSIETVPNIGIASGTGEYNGTKTCSVSGLAYDTTYTWFVNATDSGSGETTEAAYTFTTESPPPNEPPVFSNENPSDGATGISISTASVSIAIADPEGDLFDWSITTTPDVGSSSGIDEPNGTKTCTISGLAYDTTYTWTVTATDTGSGQTTEATYTFTTETEPTPEPDLDCDGELTWTDVEPGSTVEGSFTVSNIGDEDSLLDWEISDEPDWGTWTFTPSSGTDLAEGDSVTVEVEVVAPDEEEKTFTGEVTIVNSEDSSDTCTIPVSLTTPRNKHSSLLLMLLERLFERFPLLEQILTQFPVFNNILNR
jgi:hypothetical protein